MLDAHAKKTGGRRGSVPALAAALAMSFVLLALPAQAGATPGSSHVAFGAGGTAPNFGVNPSFPDCSILFPPRNCVYGLGAGESFLSIDASDEGGGLGSAFFQRATAGIDPDPAAAQITLSCVVIDDVTEGHRLYAGGTDAQAGFWSIYLEVIGLQMPSYRVASSVGSGPCGASGQLEGGGTIDAGIFTIQPVPNSPSEADLSVAKTDSPDPVVAGHPLAYTVEVTNNGPDGATGVTMRDNLPDEVTFQSVEPSESCSQSGRTVHCNIPNLASGETATADITVTPRSRGTITNSATANGNESDPDNVNNTALESTVVKGPELSVTKTDSPDPVPVGQLLTYTVTVRNDGDAAGTEVTMTDLLPAEVSFESAAPSRGSCSRSDQWVTCSFGDLASGESATTEIRVRPQTLGTITNFASAYANEGEPDTDNNIAGESTYVESGPYPRPGGAAVLRVPLVPAFAECSAPDSTHVQPLSLPSCASPVLESTVLTTSSLGRGGGFARLAVIVGNPATEADEADVRIAASASDVIRQSGASEYTGKLILTTTLRITDRGSGPNGTSPATVQDAEFSVPFDCVATPNNAVGGSCSVTTTVDTVLPGFAREGSRAVMEAFSFSVEDAGLDGSIGSSGCPPTCGTGDETLFLRQGIFAP